MMMMPGPNKHIHTYMHNYCQGQGCGEHTDCGFLTAVLQNDVEGLEVLTNQGTWVVAKPVRIYVRPRLVYV